MATVKTNFARITKQERMQMKLRQRIWADVPDEELWSRKPPTAGFTTIPRGLRHVMQIMDDMSKGKPLSATYFTLWCWARDPQVVDIVSAAELAFESGFTGQRMESTWRERMRLLASFGFLKVAEGRYGPISHVLILDPYLVVKRLYNQRLVQDVRYNALLQRLDDVGAKDLDDEG